MGAGAKTGVETVTQTVAAWRGGGGRGWQTYVCQQRVMQS